MPARRPTIELMPDAPLPEIPAPRDRRRPWLFGLVLAAALAASMGYVWSRQPIYQSAASVLTVAPSAVDEKSAGIDVQQVAVQRQTLLDVALF